MSRARIGRWSRFAIGAVLTLLVWAVHATMPVDIAGTSLDNSWMRAIQELFLERARAGVDYLFTFGPVGGLFTRSFDPSLFRFQLVVWECGFKLGMAVILTLLGMRMRPRNAALYFLLLFLLPPLSLDSYAYACMLGVTAWVIGREPLRAGLSLLGLAILSVYPLLKFAFAVPALACASAIVLRQGRVAPRGLRAVVVLAFPASTLLVWAAAGQRIADLPTWIARSLELSSAYSESMSTAAPAGVRWIAAACASVLLVQASRLLRGGPDALARRAAAATFLLVLFVAFKAAFVRASDHTPIFFGFTLLAPFLLHEMVPPAHRSARAALLLGAGCALASLVGLYVTDEGRPGAWFARTGRNMDLAVSTALHPASARSSCEARFAEASRNASLPRIRAAVGDASIDVMSFQQGALFLNGLSWRPRPVFQGIYTFTPGLMRLNADALAGEHAPAFVLFHLETIDGRFPAMDDALALQVIARDYAPVLAERGYLLLRREPRVEPSDSRVELLDREIAFGERLDLRGLPGECRLLFADIRPTPWGRLRTLLDQAPALYAEVELESGPASIVRIVPGMMRAGVLLDPFLRSQTDWIGWFVGEARPRPVSLRFLPPASPSMVRDRIRVRLVRADALSPAPRPELARELQFSLFGTLPIAVESAEPVRESSMRNRPVLVVSAPSEMRFAVGPGRHSLSGRYGILPSAWEQGGTDGADFRVLLRVAGRPDEVLLESHLDPVRVEADRRLKYLKLGFESATQGLLLLRTEPGPAGDAKGDATVWTEIAIDSGGPLDSGR